MFPKQESLASPGSNAKSVPTGGAASSEPEKGGDWGNKKGTEDDMEILSDLIKGELKLPGNKGEFICFFK